MRTTTNRDRIRDRHPAGTGRVRRRRASSPVAVTSTPPATGIDMPPTQPVDPDPVLGPAPTRQIGNAQALARCAASGASLA